jgi:pantetheine-phosphate adenylyltransferase
MMPPDPMLETSLTRKAVYAGSFDPITTGHLWIIQEAAKVFDELVVSIGINPEKKCTFTLDERMQMPREAILAVPNNVKVTSFKNRYLVDYAMSINALHIIRGIRSAEDFEYERLMRQINADIQPYVNTVYMIPPRDLSEVSSSMIKGLIGPIGWENAVKRYVPEPVMPFVRGKFNV